jgi:DNA-binding protein HU-beta
LLILEHPIEKGGKTNMLKQEINRKVQSVTGSTLKDATAAVDAVFDTIAEALENGENVVITGFGQFTCRTRKARTGVNPQRPHEKIQLPEVIVPAFRPGKTLKDRVRNKKK